LTELVTSLSARHQREESTEKKAGSESLRHTYHLGDTIF
jgi:hypothetical protein